MTPSPRRPQRDGFEIDRARAAPAVPRDLPRDRGRLLRALRGGAPAHGDRDRQTPGAGRWSPPARASCPTRSQRWTPFKETARSSCRSSRRSTNSGLLSNIDDKLLGQTRRHIQTDFDLVVTAQQVRSYKPEPAHFTECARRIGGKRGWVHVTSSHYHDVVPCLKAAGPRHLGQPQQRDARLLAEKADGRGHATSKRPRSCSASPELRRAVRAVSLHRDVLVVTSAVLQLNCVIVRGRAAAARRPGARWA